MVFLFLFINEDLFGAVFAVTVVRSYGCNSISHITVQTTAAAVTVDAVNMLHVFTIEICFFFCSRPSY